MTGVSSSSGGPDQTQVPWEGAQVPGQYLAGGDVPVNAGEVLFQRPGLRIPI